MIGPGKYDAHATMVRLETGAEGVIVLVLGGKAGSGFSVQGTLDVQFRLPTLLRSMADQIEGDLRSGKL
jgi:hypothetical protein